MNRDQLEELASLHALGLLEGEELRAFEQELASNPASRQLVAEIKDRYERPLKETVEC